MRVDFTIHTAPVSKQRPRLGKGGCVYTPSKTKVFENIVALSYGNRPSFDDKYIRIRLKFKFEVPKSYSKKKRLEAIEGKIRPTKADIDNYIKAVLDGLNKKASALSLSQHQGLFQGVDCSHQMTKILELQLQHQSFQ